MMGIETEPATADEAIANLRADIAAALDGVEAIEKVRGLTDERRAAAQAPLLEALADGIGALGEPVARGNRLFVVHDGRLIRVDMTPRVLVRV